MWEIRIVNTILGGWSMFRILVMVFIATLISGCSNINQPNAEESVNSSTSPVSPSSQAPAPEPPENRPALDESFLAAEANVCSLQEARVEQRQPNNVGFPLSETWIPTLGTANFLVVPVTFSDIASENVPLDFIRDTAGKVSRWYAQTSRGKLEVKFDVIENWVELNAPSTDFVFEKGKANVQTTNEDLIRNQLQAEMTESVIANLNDKSVLQGKDALFLVFPQGARAIKTSILQRGVDLPSTPEVENLMVWGTGTDAPVRELEWALWIHEALHDQGLPLHAPGNGSDFGLGQNQYAKSSTLSGWEQFKLGWLSGDEVLCLDADKLDINGWHFNLGIFELPDSKPNVAILRLTDYEAIVIESRRPVGYSENYSNLHGAIVYKVDTRLDNDRASECCEDYGNDPEFDKWAYLIAPDDISNSKQSTGGTSDKFIFEEGDEASIGDYILRLQQSAELDSFTFARR